MPKVYLVMWSECDSGYEIKGAFSERSKAQAQVDALNAKERQRMIDDTEDWILKHPERSAPFESHASHREFTLNAANKYGNQHHVEEVEVEDA